MICGRKVLIFVAALCSYVAATLRRRYELTRRVVNDWEDATLFLATGLNERDRNDGHDTIRVCE